MITFFKFMYVHWMGNASARRWATPIRSGISECLKIVDHELITSFNSRHRYFFVIINLPWQLMSITFLPLINCVPFVNSLLLSWATFKWLIRPGDILFTMHRDNSDQFSLSNDQTNHWSLSCVTLVQIHNAFTTRVSKETIDMIIAYQ